MAGNKRIVGPVVARATARYQPVAARKARYVADLIRGQTVAEAQTTLSLVHRPSAVPIVRRLLQSAAANSQRPDSEGLVVGRIWVDGGPMMKRWRPRAYGRAAMIRKRLCHITIELTEEVGRIEEVE
jgi:large subunit ribosomal protein L22